MDTTRDTTEPETLDPALVDLLRCPLCPDRPRLRLADDKKSLICACGKNTFPIVHGLPDLRPPGEQEVAPAAKE